MFPKTEHTFLSRRLYENVFMLIGYVVATPSLADEQTLHAVNVDGLGKCLQAMMRKSTEFLGQP